jgi:hypothetical protein
MKTGEGFRRWTPEEADAVQARLATHLEAMTNPIREPIGAATSPGGAGE